MIMHSFVIRALPILLTCMGLSMLTISGSAMAGKPAIAPGQPAPDFTLDLVKGGRISLAELKGQVVVLNFWATWCAPCKKELPILDAFYDVLKDKGLRVYAITTEDSAPLRQLKALFDLMTIPAVKHLKGSYGTIKAVPTNIVIGRDGTIRYAAAGALDLDKLNKILIPLINEPVPPSSPITTASN